MKPLQWRRPARQDAMTAAKWYERQAGLPTGERFLSALAAGLAHVRRNPAAGSPRYAALLRVGDLRFWPLKGFPYLIFYIEREQHTDVWRVLHAQRDIPTWMGAAP